MIIIGVFIAAIAGGLIGSMLCELACVWWRVSTEQWPRELHVRGAKITIFRDGFIVFRRANGSWWAEQLCHRDREFKYAAESQAADHRQELH
jgi:hypothetical protein